MENQNSESNPVVAINEVADALLECAWLLFRIDYCEDNHAFAATRPAIRKARMLLDRLGYKVWDDVDADDLDESKDQDADNGRL